MHGCASAMASYTSDFYNAMQRVQEWEYNKSIHKSAKNIAEKYGQLWMYVYTVAQKTRMLTYFAIQLLSHIISLLSLVAKVAAPMSASHHTPW